MKLSPDIDLGRSLLQVFGNKPDSATQIEQDRSRQTATVNAILQRFFRADEQKRRELTILADEVGLGKTYVALAVAVSILVAIRRGESPDGLPANKPIVLVVTPSNDALFNKWLREAEAFKNDCAKHPGVLEWLQIRTPIENSSKSGNVVDLAAQMRDATRSQPMLLIAKQGTLGAALHNRDLWRRRGLAAVFNYYRTPPDTRRYWCRKGKVFENFGIPELTELLDLRTSAPLWSDPISPDLERAYHRAMSSDRELSQRLGEGIAGSDEDWLSRLLDDLTRHALASDWPTLPLVIVDEVHGFKNEHVQARRNFETFMAGRVCRFLGLSATPFQLRHDELLSLLKLRWVLALPTERFQSLDNAVTALGEAMRSARDVGDVFRRRWKGLQQSDKEQIGEAWRAVADLEFDEQFRMARQLRPPRLAHAIEAALDLGHRNTELQRHLHPFVIRHQHPRGYREHFVGGQVETPKITGSPTFQWAPGMEVRGNDELAQYLMMRAIALAKDEKGLPSLGAELSGSYRHLVETAAVWKKLAQASNPLLRDYRAVLEGMIGTRTEQHDPDNEHRKVQATVRRVLEFFKRGQKSLVFCVYTKTAETVRDQIKKAVEEHLDGIHRRVFGDASSFKNFQRRFFNRYEPLFSLIQDHPLLGRIHGGSVGIPQHLALTHRQLREVATLLVDTGASPDSDKPDRRLILAATEQVAVKMWRESEDGQAWLSKVLRSCPELADRMVDSAWLEAREPLSRSERAGRVRRAIDPEAGADASDPLEAEESEAETSSQMNTAGGEPAVESWVRRLREDAIGRVIAPYLRHDVTSGPQPGLPLLAQHHCDLLADLDLDTRCVAGQVFRRILMADEFLLRYLADVEKENTERWADFLAERYEKPLDGHLESLRDRVVAYLETLARAQKNKSLLAGYHAGAENRNVVQLVKGDTQARDRYFLGFNTPYRPEILISTSVGQEGIDLHRECRHVIHHDLCWNPATIEQRTGRVDRIGSKVERERLGAKNGEEPTLEIAVPYLAATYDERMFEELYRRAQLFEVTLGGDIRVEGRIDPDQIAGEHRRREKAGIGTDDEDIGEETDDVSVVDIPEDMLRRLRVDLSV
jgi:hypothetical protein